MQISTKPYYAGIRPLDTSIRKEGSDIHILQQVGPCGDYHEVKLNAKHKRDLYDALRREFGNA